jgi:hypothetical protein
MIAENVKIAIIGAAAAIIGAIIGAAGGIIVALIIAGGNSGSAQVVPFIKEVRVVVRNRDTGVPLPGADITVNDSNGKLVAQTQTELTGDCTLWAMPMDDYTVWARAVDYKEEKQVYNLHVDPWVMRLTYLPTLSPLPFAGWNSWGKVSANPRSNTVTLNGAFTTAGYMVTNIRSLGGRKLVLEFAGTTNSSFYNNQLLKLETGDNAALKPLGGLEVIGDGYIPVVDGRVTFAIPDSFDGKLNMVFYKAELRNLRISAFYK